MQSTTLDSSFVDRLKQILANRFGKSLQVRQLLNISEFQNEKEFYIRGRDLHVPIKVNGSLLGTAVIPSAEDLDTEMSEDIAQLTRMVLEPAMYKWYLTQKESNLAAITQAGLSVENIELFGESINSSEEVESDEESSTDVSLASRLNTQIIHLEGSSYTAHKKTALLLHEMTGRWAFVPYADIKNQLHSAEDFSKLGAMTIYVENAELLNTSEQELLLNFLDEKQGQDEPLIISTTTLSADELYAATDINEPLVDEMIANSFDVDRAPLSNGALKEVLEMFFFSSEDPSDA